MSWNSPVVLISEAERALPPIILIFWASSAMFANNQWPAYLSDYMYNIFFFTLQPSQFVSHVNNCFMDIFQDLWCHTCVWSCPYKRNSDDGTDGFPKMSTSMENVTPFFIYISQYLPSFCTPVTGLPTIPIMFPCNSYTAGCVNYLLKKPHLVP